MNVKKLLSVILTHALVISLLSAALPMALAAAEASDWDVLSAALAKGGEVKLNSDVTAPAERACILEVPEGVTATLDLNGFTLDGGTPGEEDCVVRVYGDFTLSDSSPDGTGRITGTRDAVDVCGGSFTMTGGTVDGCGWIGVAVIQGGTVTMTGGTILDSYCEGLGVFEGSTAVVSGGTISGSRGYFKDDWFYGGTGVYIDGGSSVVVSGGVLSGNVFGIRAIDSSLVFSGGEVRDCPDIPLDDEGMTYGGAGIYAIRSAVDMRGGTVSGCDFTGIYPDEGAAFTVSGGTVVGDGTVSAYLLGGTLTLTGGTLTGGQSSCVWVNGGALRVEGGELGSCENAAVWIANGEASVTGGTIGGGGYFGIHLDSGTLTLSGSPRFSDNGFADLLLANNQLLTIGGALTPAAPISVVSYELTLNGGAEALITTGLSGNGSAADFVFPGELYEIVPTDDGEAKAVYIRHFPDVTGSEWYAAAVSYAALYGIFEGTEKGFEPDMELTNAMAVQALWNHAEKPAAASALPDTAADVWYADALNWAAEIGVVDGGADFRPDAPITREAFAVMCYRFVQSSDEAFADPESFPLDFADADAVSDDAREALRWCVMNGILLGMGDGTLAPQSTVTRAQAATILLRLYNTFGA